VGSTDAITTEIAPCARCGHAPHQGPKSGPLACTDMSCDCREYVSKECPGYLGNAKPGTSRVSSTSTYQAALTPRPEPG